MLCQPGSDSKNLYGQVLKRESKEVDVGAYVDPETMADNEGIVDPISKVEIERAISTMKKGIRTWTGRGHL